MMSRSCCRSCSRRSASDYHLRLPCMLVPVGGVKGVRILLLELAAARQLLAAATDTILAGCVAVNCASVAEDGGSPWTCMMGRHICQSETTVHALGTHRQDLGQDILRRP